jgi:predicted alpha/beta-fold hydrolase
MADLTVPTLILYAADDPLFDPSIIPDLQGVCAANPHLDLVLTRHGGHVGYYSGVTGQRRSQDPDPWWAWNRVLDWVDQRSHG